MTSHDDDETSARILPSGTTPAFRYRIVEKVGAGGMGEVHLAEDTSLHRRVALKFLPAHLAADPDLRARFQREAQAAARLDHPVIVTIHDVGELDGRPYIAMQFVEGRALSHYCREEPLPVAGIARLVAQVCDGLAAAHAAGVTHRDIKPANILVDREMRPRILDFGLASVRGSEDLTRTGSTLGTVAYMSPEQAQGQPAGHRSDLFSVGIVLYELVAGRTPFRRESEAATLRAIVADDPEPLARYKADAPAELQRIVSKCLAKRADERYQSAADLAADLRVLERSGSGPTAATPSIAVLPFTNMSADPENEYFSDGLTEELLNVLAKNPGLKVTGRTSSFAFKGKQEDLRLIGQKLGVGVLLEGSVRKAGNRVRITAQLVNAADGFHLWSESYDRVLDDIFVLQDDIARAVAGALNVTLLGKGRRKVNAEAYALVLRAQQSARLMTGPGLDLAIQLYRKALELDPDDARAWAGAARTYAVQSAYGHGDGEEASRQAKECIERAMQLDDQLPDAYETLGFVRGALELRFRESRELTRKAVELAPNSSRAVGSLAMQEGIFGRFEEALCLARRAVELDPLDPDQHMQLGRILQWAHQPEAARAAFLRGLELSPGVTGAHGWVSQTWIMERKLDEALAEARLEESAGYRDCNLAVVFHARGEKEEADRALERLLSYGDRWAVQFACVHAFRDERDKAFEWLRRAVELRDSGIPMARVQPLLENLHDDPRWVPFLEEIGLAE